MRLPSRFLVAAFFLCQSIAWTCPAYCSTLSAQSERQEIQTAVGHEHHHSGGDGTSAGGRSETQIPSASLTGMHCKNCGVAAPTILVRASEPLSVSPVVDAELATPAAKQARVVNAIHFASTPPPDTSPPPGIFPLRI